MASDTARQFGLVMMAAILCFCFLGLQLTLEHTNYSNCTTCVIKVGESTQLPLEHLRDYILSLSVITLTCFLMAIFLPIDPTKRAIYLVNPIYSPEEHDATVDAGQEEAEKLIDAAAMVQ